MPNWCEGFLKVRGKIANLKAFVLNGLQPVTYSEDCAKLIFETEDDISFTVSGIDKALYLRGTHRNFCEPDHIEMYCEDTETPEILILPMKAAWDIDPEPLLTLCKVYDVDMKIQGFEQGMQFSRIIEIVNGEVLQNEIIHYDNWDWDCPCPRMGG